MPNPKKKKILWLILVFGAVVLLMIVNTYRSTHVRGLAGPLSGVGKLFSLNQNLIAVSRDNKLYIWDWSDLATRAKVRAIKSNTIAAMENDKLLWSPHPKSGYLAVSNLKKDKDISRLLFETDRKCLLLKASQNGKFAIAALEADGYPHKQIELTKIGSDFTSVLPIESESTDGLLRISDIAISNDGRLLAAVGEKTNGWIWLVDAETKKTLWQYSTEDSPELNNVVFSPDGNIVYASEPGRFVYAFQTAAGKLIRKFEMDKYNTPSNNPQTISCMDISGDGKLLAAATEPASNVRVWNAVTGEKFALIGGESYTVTGISFSPDASMLATGILVRSTVNIWKLPEKP